MGGAVPGATVIVRTDSGIEEQTITGPDGRFTLRKATAGATLIVRAGGFAEKRQELSAAADLRIVVTPPALLETVTVTPVRNEELLGNIPASINILTSEDIDNSPAVV